MGITTGAGGQERRLNEGLRRLPGSQRQDDRGRVSDARLGSSRGNGGEEHLVLHSRCGEGLLPDQSVRALETDHGIHLPVRSVSMVKNAVRSEERTCLFPESHGYGAPWPLLEMLYGLF